jgi:recombinational DNA repair ATPase RecF
VDEQLSASGVDDETGLAILAALEGDAELDAYLADGSSSARQTIHEETAATEVGGTFLRSIAVEGFRGIGPRTELRLSPQPGLTIVAGRNGSGKSSLSEALEFVLTGDTYRWKSKSSVEWRQQWRNLHHPDASIELRFVEEDALPLTVSATWDVGATDVANATVKSQRQGQKQQIGLEDLGWGPALEQYRPILSYDELGSLLESGRAQLYDALASILGVEQLSHAIQRIRSRLKERKGPKTAATARRKQLLVDAQALDDERAQRAAQGLKTTSPDVATLRALATGSAVPDTGPLQPLRNLASLSLPFSAEDVAETTTRLRSAVAGLADAGADVSARSVARLELLESALRVHAEHGDMTCPVCRKGELDADWRELSTQLATAERRELNDVTLAHQTLSLAFAQARRLVTARPAMLQQAPDDALAAAVTDARTAWDRWCEAPSGGSAGDALSLADHLDSTGRPLLTAVDSLCTSAASRLSELEDVWQPFATQLAAWCDEWDACLAARPVVARLAEAEKWLKTNDLRLKNERLAPIEERAKAAWAKLRQESNVDLGALTLTGTGTQRRVRIDASVDGTDVQGFTVLSQGELHALALSLFIPRATMAASPFRFLVLDDPIQAMDPAKVDGLVELLTDLAKTHQVIVLSHDDRLPAAVRRSAVGATILEVSRGKDSTVTIETATDPAQRYLDDAFGLVLEAEAERLTDSAMRRTLPGLLRFAVEAAAKDRYFSRRLTAGDSVTAVEDAWERATTTRLKVTLAVFGELRETHELDQWASAPYRKFALKTIGPAMHNGLKPDLNARDAAKDVQRLVSELRSAT